MTGVAAVQERIAAIEQRFAVAAPAARPQEEVTFARSLATAEAALVPMPERPATAAGGPFPLGRPHQLSEPPRVHSTEMGPASPPAELAAYGTGQISPEARSPIGGGDHRLWAPAAGAFRNMQAAAARDGVTIEVTDSYRSFDRQVDLAERKGLYSQGGLAARPGTSNHGWGRSLDLDTGGGTADWLRANAARFGFHEDVPGEPWHWTYRPS